MPAHHDRVTISHPVESAVPKTIAMALLVLSVSAAAQGPPPAVRSPEVHADRRVTFRLRAPAATRVELVGEVLQGQEPQTMTKGADGVWTVTIGPLPPEIWIYNFRVEGVEFPDPANISQMPRAAGTAAISSFVEVPGDTPAFYDARPVPHGEVRMVLYESKAMGVDRYLWVYTPPNYDTSKARYPVYYLLHGNGETQSGWVMLESTTSKLASGKGSLRASPVCTSTLSATPSIVALLSVPAALLPLRSSCCHLSMPTARPVERRLAAPMRNNPSPHPTSSTRSFPFQWILLRYVSRSRIFPILLS